MKRKISFILTIILVISMLCSCAKKPETEDDGTTAEAQSAVTSSSAPTETQSAPAQTSSAPVQTTRPQENIETTKETTTQRQSVKVTIPEGYSFMQIANTLESKGICKAADFYETAQAYQVQSFTIPSSSNRCFKLEGYLYPDTYEFYKNEKPETVIRRMLNNYASKSGMPSDETLILASIIEKETRSTSHMKMVSSVFHNRLNQNKQLEADSTRDYVNKYITGNSLLSSTGKYAPLYNTYKCAALPAGPICSPGARAIEAAKNPSSSEYLYFFFGNDNDNHYSKTYEEHQAQIEEFGVQYGH